MGQVRAQAGSVLVSVVGTGCALCRLGGGAGPGANVTDVQSAGAGGMRAYDDEPGASRPLPLSPASLAPVRQCLDKITTDVGFVEAPLIASERVPRPSLRAVRWSTPRWCWQR
jgi:hypothetical protein